MSESSAGGTSTGSASSSTAGATAATTQATSSETTGLNQQGTAGKEQVSQAAKKTQASPAPSESEFEEVALGSTKGKASKEIAQTIKALEKGFQSKSQELAQKNKLMSLAKENPKEFFKQTGVDAYEFAEKLLAEKYEQMQMSPEQRELMELKAEKAQREQQEQASKQEILSEIKKFVQLPEGAEKASKEELVQFLNHQKQTYQKVQNQIETEFVEALKAENLPAKEARYLLAKASFEMSSALKQGKSLTPKQAIAKVKGEFIGSTRELFGAMSDEQLHQALEDGLFDRIQKFQLNRLTASAASKFGTQNQGQAQASTPPVKQKPMNEIEWRRKYSGR